MTYMTLLLTAPFDVQESGVQGTTGVVTIDLRPEISIWCDPSELAEIALRKARRADEETAAAELLELANGDRSVVRQAMEYVVGGVTGGHTQAALRLLFNAYQLATDV
jgi:hypothetical protein